MKHNSKQSFLNKSIRAVMLMLGGLMVAIFPTASVYADQFDDQINALKGQVSQYQSQASQLHAQADTLQNALGALGAQQSALRTQISETQVKLDQLAQQIQDTETKIENQKTALALNLRAMYLEESVTPLEMVASSQSISDFVDKQEYRNKIRDAVQTSLKDVQQLKDNLVAQQKSVQQNLTDQTSMQQQVAAQQQQQNDLLQQTQGQEANYQQLVSQKNDEITKLRAAQAAANLKWSGGHINFQARGGGYPSYWADPAMDSIVDDWGMFNRECTGYAAFRVAASGRHMPYGFGNANQWPGSARAAGIPVDTSPRAGDVAIWSAGYYGHAMYVESVNGDGSILISEYNYDWTGRYSQRILSSSTWQAQSFVFIHF